MDKQQRLTRWDEWKEGFHYERLKCRRTFGPYILISANPNDDFILLQDAVLPGIPLNAPQKISVWRKRYRRIT